MYSKGPSQPSGPFYRELQEFQNGGLDMKRATILHPSEIGVNPEFDTMLSAMLNIRFNGFLQCLASNLGIELETMITVSRTILDAAEIKQDN